MQKDKFSDEWWKQHDRLISISKQLERLWGLRRLEMAGESISAKNEPILDEIFADYLERAGLDANGRSVWRVEDEIADGRRWMSVDEALRENQYGHYLKKPTKKTAKKRAKMRKQRQLA